MIRAIAIAGLVTLLCLGCSVSSASQGHVETVAGTAGHGGSGGLGLVASGGRVDIEGVFNARQPGTLAIGEKTLRPNLLIRSGDLHEMTDDGCGALDRLRVTTIVDLRDDPDFISRPDHSCNDAVRETVRVALPKLLPPTAENYLATLDALEPHLASLLAAIESANGAVLIHCVIGRDRATLTMALILLALGVDDQAVISDASENQDASVTVDSFWMDGVFARIARAGGIDNYLATCNVPATVLESLRGKMTE